MMKKLISAAKSGGPLWGLIFVFILFSILVEDGGFYRVHNIKTILSQSIILGVGALGMALVMTGVCLIIIVALLKCSL